MWVTFFLKLFLAILQTSLLWLNLPQCSQGVLPPNFQQFVIIWPGFPRFPQLFGFKRSTLLTKPTFSVDLPCLFLSSVFQDIFSHSTFSAEVTRLTTHFVFQSIIISRYCYFFQLLYFFVHLSEI